MLFSIPPGISSGIASHLQRLVSRLFCMSIRYDDHLHRSYSWLMMLIFFLHFSDWPVPSLLLSYLIFRFCSDWVLSFHSAFGCVSHPLQLFLLCNKYLSASFVCLKLITWTSDKRPCYRRFLLDHSAEKCYNFNWNFNISAELFRMFGYYNSAPHKRCFFICFFLRKCHIHSSLL